MQDPAYPIPYTPREAALASKALAEHDSDALRTLLYAACQMLRPTRSPRLFARRVAQQLMLANPEDMLLPGRDGSPRFNPEHAETLAYAMSAAFLSHGIELDARQAADDFLGATIPQDLLSNCPEPFADGRGAGAAKNHCPEIQQAAALRCKWHRRFDLLMAQEDLSPSYRHAARAFLTEGHQFNLSTPEQLKFHISMRTLDELLAENSKHSKLAASWLAALYDANWGRDMAKAILLKAKALCEAPEIEQALIDPASAPKTQAL